MSRFWKAATEAVGPAMRESAADYRSKRREDRRRREKEEAEQAEREKQQRIAKWLASLHGLHKDDNPDHDIYQQIESGDIDWDTAKQAITVRQQQHKAEEQQQEEMAAAEAAMQARRQEEINLGASGALGGVPPALHQTMAGGVATETDPGRQFSMREALMNRAKSAKTGRATEEVKQQAAQQIKNPVTRALYLADRISEQEAGVIPYAGQIEKPPTSAELRQQASDYRTQQERLINSELTYANADLRNQLVGDARERAIQVIGPEEESTDPMAYPADLAKETDKQLRLMIDEQNRAKKLELYKSMGESGDLDATLESILGEIDAKKSETADLVRELDELRSKLR